MINNKPLKAVIAEYVERNDVRGLAEFFRAYVEDEMMEKGEIHTDKKDWLDGFNMGKQMAIDEITKMAISNLKQIDSDLDSIKLSTGIIKDSAEKRLKELL